jgi:hypothetical protein
VARTHRFPKIVQRHADITAGTIAQVGEACWPYPASVALEATVENALKLQAEWRAEVRRGDRAAADVRGSPTTRHRGYE